MKFKCQSNSYKIIIKIDFHFAYFPSKNECIISNRLRIGSYFLVFYETKINLCVKAHSKDPYFLRKILQLYFCSSILTIERFQMIVELDITLSDT